MKYYRLLTALPALPDSPGRSQITLEEVISMFQQDLVEEDWVLAEAVLRWLDCENYEAKITGRQIFDERARLKRESLDDRRELPDFIVDFAEALESGSLGGSYPPDELWRAYHRNLTEAAKIHHCPTLGEWASWEGGLRNALARIRAQAMGADLEGRLFEDAEDESLYSELVVWAGEAADPLERERILDQARLNKLTELAGASPFSREAALCYLTAILVLDRWYLPKDVDAEKLLEVFS
jgi:hypothetical protein